VAIWKNLLQALIFQEPKQEEPFELKAQQDSLVPDLNGTGKPGGSTVVPGAGCTGRQATAAGGENKRRQMRKPTRITKKGLKPSQADKLKEDELSPNLDLNLKRLKEILNVPLNQDVNFREFTIGIRPPVRGAAIFMEGMADKKLQSLGVLQPLMLLSSLGAPEPNRRIEDIVTSQLLPNNDIGMVRGFREVVGGIVRGKTALLVDGAMQAIIADTIGGEHRNVEQPVAERVLRGPHEAFNETLKVCTALVRKRIHSEHLITERFKVGGCNQLDGSLMYIDNIANPALVKEVRRRLRKLVIDVVTGTGALEELIEDNPFIFLPQTQVTERPDRVAASLVEGRVAILLDGTPQVAVVPTSFWSLLQSPEDYYVRPPIGSFLRVIRLAAILVSLLLPAVYLAVAAFHHEMIPTDLLLSISANREKVPFPSVVEVAVMEFSFDLIREAGIRIPGLIGPTLGIVGAIILGQAAVAASLVSPLLIIIVALTGISSFAITDYNLQNAFRLHRFAYITLAAIFGFFGIAITLILHLLVMANVKSFGVPYLAPVAPRKPGELDVLARGLAFEQELRPPYIYPQNVRRQPRISRKWILKHPKGPRGTGGAEK